MEVSEDFNWDVVTTGMFGVYVMVDPNTLSNVALAF
jgi:hypothetical protein